MEKNTSLITEVNLQNLFWGEAGVGVRKPWDNEHTISTEQTVLALSLSKSPQCQLHNEQAFYSAGEVY